MPKVEVLYYEAVQYDRDVPEAPEEWDYQGTEVYGSRLLAIHRTRKGFRERGGAHHFYADLHYIREGKKIVSFELPDGAEHGYVVYVKHNEYNTFGGQENLLMVFEVFEHEDDAKAFVAKIENHFTTASSFDLTYGPRTYPMYFDQVVEVAYEKVAVE